MAWSQSVEADLRNGVLPSVNKTLGDAFNEYIERVCPRHKSGENEIKRINALRKMLPADRRLDQVKAIDIANFRDERLKKVKPNTVRKEMVILRCVFEEARREWGWIKTNPMSDVKKPPAGRPRRQTFADEDVQKILDALGFKGAVETLQHQVAISLQLGIETGMRAGEMLALRPSDIHLDDRYLTVRDSKNGDHRDVPLSTKAVELLRVLMAGTGEVFTVSSASRDALFRKARTKAGIKGLRFHDSRATALTRISRKLDVLQLAKMIGHRDPRSLMIYFRESASEMARRLD